MPRRGIADVMPTMPEMTQEEAIQWMIRQPEILRYLFWRLQRRMVQDPVTKLWKGAAVMAPKPKRVKKPKVPKPSGRPEEHIFADYADIFPSSESASLELGPLHWLLNARKEIPKKSLWGTLRRWEDDGLITVVRPDGRPMRYWRKPTEIEV